MTTARRINPDRPLVIGLTIATALAIVTSSFVLSYAGLTAVAEWGGVPAPLRPLVPVMIDAALLTYTAAWLVQRARHESAALSWCSLALFTVVSIMGNSLHGWMPPEEVQRIVGTVVVGLAPLAVLLATHTIAQLLTPPVNDAVTPSPLSVLEGIENASLHLVQPEQLDALRDKIAEQRKPARGRRRVTSPQRAAARERARDLRAKGHTVRQIAAEVGLSHSTVAEDVRDVVPA
jgi:hypothetical protein